MRFLLSSLIFFWAATCPAFSASAIDFMEHYNRANEYFSNNEFAKSVAECDQAIKADPSRYEAYLRKARALNEVGRAREALIEFNKCLKLKVLGEIYQSRGLSYRILENYPAALADWWHCIELDPDYEKAYWRIADLHLRRHEYKECLKVYARAIANKSTAARGYRKRGQLYALMNQYSKAVADHDASLKLKPDNATTFYSRSKVHAQFKHYDLAVKDMTRAVELEPKDASFYTVLGAFLVQTGKLKDAEVVLNRALAIRPDSAAAHNNRGILYEKLGQLEQAKAEFDKAVESDPSRAIYYANHARVAVTTGDTDDAVDDFVNLSKASEPSSSAAADVNFKIVIAQFDKVIKLNPSDAANYYNRGVAYYCLGDFKNAHRDFASFIRISQWHGDAPVYAAILDSTALRRLHKVAEADQVLAEAKSKRSGAWSELLIQGVSGDIGADQLLQASRLHNKEAVARCFLGLNALALGNKAVARENLSWVKESADQAVDEYSLATSQLARIEPTNKTAKTAGHPGTSGVAGKTGTAAIAGASSDLHLHPSADKKTKQLQKSGLVPPTLIVK